MERQTLHDSTYTCNLKKKNQPHIVNSLPQDFPAPWLTLPTSLPLIPGHGLYYAISAPLSHPEPPSKSQCKHPTPGPQPLPSQMTWQGPSTLSRPSGVWFYHCLSCLSPPWFNSFQNKSIPSPNKSEWLQGVVAWGCGLGVSIFQSSLVIRICSWFENHCSPSEYENIQFSS